MLGHSRKATTTCMKISPRCGEVAPGTSLGLTLKYHLVELQSRITEQKRKVSPGRKFLLKRTV